MTAGFRAAISVAGVSMISETSARLVGADASTVSKASGGSNCMPSRPYSAAFFSMMVMARMMGT